jgi:hypothetical protein
MASLRSEMKEALKEDAVPYLKSLGFKGSMPDFYRRQDEYTECLQFHFKRDADDERFFVHAALASNDGVDWHRPTHHRVPPEKVKVTQLKGAIRLGAKPGSNDHWFDFENTRVEDVVQEVLSLLSGQEYWQRLARVPVTTQGVNYR